MSERDRLLEDLVAEVLGPRGGPTERMRDFEDPVDEYITGVLAPHTAPSVELDADEELVGGPLEEEADPDPGTGMTGHAEADYHMPSLVVDPRARPASMGVSFAIEAQAAPLLDICCTWARYAPVTEGGWQRRPYGAVWRGVDCGSECTLSYELDPALLVRIRGRQNGTGLWRISVFVVNATQPRSERPSTEEHVFQPQVRIRCPDGARLVSLERGRPAQDGEEQGVALLYKHRPVLARGHLCSALWHDVDPERHNDRGLRADHPPFVWSDGRYLFDEATAADFEAPDVRSEFVPVIPVNAPSKAWPEKAGRPPELDPRRLAELFDGEALRAALVPLTDAYERWIDARANEAQPAVPNSPAERHLKGLRRALSRLRDGVDLLAANDDARLAFCFANQAIALQSEWTKGRVNNWWPFQLAFQLLNIRAVVDDTHPDREVCDLLWFPTGGGKTEAYLGLAAFTLAHRRLRARRARDPRGGAGVAVLSRYTLRLLTIQQYRRALALVTACEFLRVQGRAGRRGWRPAGLDDDADLLWGKRRFSIGLWAGGNVTPNGMQDFAYRLANGRVVQNYGAISILEKESADGGEPAQVLNCPTCGSIVAIPPGGLAGGEEAILHLVIGDTSRSLDPSVVRRLSQEPFEVMTAVATPHSDASFVTVSVTFRPAKDATTKQVDDWIDGHVRRLLGGGSWLVPARGSRPGYFVREVEWSKRAGMKPVDFEIFCPNPECHLNTDVAWAETTEVGAWQVPKAFEREAGVSGRCPIPAWTVDEQVYAHCPSMVVATVDKFARLAFEPRAGALFGNVDRFNEHLGYYRSWAPPAGPTSSLATRPREELSSGRNIPVFRFRPPELILQDELHLIEGPLGSMVGIYEAGIDLLATNLDKGRVRPKYVASTATVRQADDQVRSLFSRNLEVFPPPALRAEESFFSSTGPGHPLDSTQPGRVHVGVIAPGRGAQTPLVRIWSRLLQTPADRLQVGASPEELDSFWTLVGYFNAIRELAGAVALTRQDILQRLRSIAKHPRELGDPMELSSRVDSLRLPGMLQELTVRLPGGGTPVNAVVATSMFGTGVDVDRLGLMLVHGQPKTTSSYIQATGRVGRSRGGLVVTFYRASRPRDLSHYEYFAGYHTALYRHVEPVAVNPFAPRTRDRALGPLAVSILRQAAQLPGLNGPVDVDDRWRVQQRLKDGWACHAGRMRDARNDPEVTRIPELLEERASAQPPSRRPNRTETADHVSSELSRWKQLAERVEDRLLFYEATVTRSASRAVVLGDLAHLVAGTGQVYDNAPNSLREVEATITIRGRN